MITWNLDIMSLKGLKSGKDRLFGFTNIVMKNRISIVSVVVEISFSSGVQRSLKILLRNLMELFYCRLHCSVCQQDRFVLQVEAALSLVLGEN